MNELLLIVLAYFIGSIPSALIISKVFFHIDIRDFGSGNMGATNTFRVLGKGAGSAVLLIDVIKGLTAASLVRYYSFVDLGSLFRSFYIGLIKVGSFPNGVLIFHCFYTFFGFPFQLRMPLKVFA